MASSGRKLRVLCLHGFRTSGAFLEKQISRWSPSVRELLDMTFLDGPFPAAGKSDIEAIFPGPFFEWFQFRNNFTEFTNLEECMEFIANYMYDHGPFDGLLGFSQGGVLSAAFAGLQQKGLALNRHPPLRFILLISGAGFNNKDMMEKCYSENVKCPSVHIIGAQDHLKDVNEELVLLFENPVVIRHGGKHMVPRLDEEMTSTLREFLLQVQSTLSVTADSVGVNKKEETFSGLQNGLHKDSIEDLEVAFT